MGRGILVGKREKRGKDMTELEKARKVFGKIAFAAEVTGCVIREVGEGYAVCTLDLEPRHKNALGAPMGGAVFTLADYAFGVASNFNRDVFVSTEASSHFLAASRGSVLRAEAREIRCGRRTCLFSVAVTDDLGVQVARFTFSGMKVLERGKKT